MDARGPLAIARLARGPYGVTAEGGQLHDLKAQTTRWVHLVAGGWMVKADDRSLTQTLKASPARRSG